MSNDPVPYIKKILPIVYSILAIVVGASLVTFYLHNFYDPNQFESNDGDSRKETKAGYSTEGLVDDVGKDLVVANCTACHSAKLITQNRATKEGWKSMIVWMQKTQNLWQLGENEQPILEYLARNYAPEKKGRRANLSDIEWYELEP